ncbi:hypothetical protein Fmac_006977 [Flemingia macrophylla]|uniref:Kinesin-like protein n=1 Tax=Flemingia macrophylla TaxID=520843 RepID=A0ABD1NDC1_9FABA
MDDQTIDMLTQKFSRFVIHGDSNPSSGNALAELNTETSHKLDENSASNGNHEYSPDNGHTHPISKKILDLSTKVQNLKKEHVALSDQVKLMTESFPGQDVLKSVQLLGAKYMKEHSERRKLYNEVIELKGNIRVFCRCRPLNESELANGSSVSVVNFDSSPDELQVNCTDSSKKQFKFDFVFRPEDNQETVFEQTKPIITSVLDGYNVCIFAYGQTGTGKTFTMEGTPEHRGVNYRTLEELFRVSEERQGIVKYELFVSMLEVYNEKIRDLLVENSVEPVKKLEIKQAADGTQEVPGLVEARVYGTEDVWEKLNSGNRVRSVGSTSANELSSRSHCLLRVTVLGENLIDGQKTRSHLWLVDLAGSERVGKTEAEGERLKESQFINKSLSALGDVISALASKSAHIPYRNSKLTHILQSSLGGDCKTLMFVQISPSARDSTETLCSLNFATRVRGIESGPARKQTDHTELYKYKQMVEKLKHDEKETRKLQDNVQTLQTRLAARELMCRNLQEKVRELENQIAEERKIRLKQESRLFASVSAQPLTASESTINHANAQKTVNKPPLNPSKRPPLRKITNFLPPPPERRPSCSSSIDAKENTVRTFTTNAQGFMQARRRVSVAARPPPSAPMTPSTTKTLLQPRRRVSVATLCPVTTSNMTTPHRSPTQQSLIRNHRKNRYSRLFTSLPETRTSVETSSPTLMRNNSKFAGSPTQADSQMARHSTVVALQRKPLVWTPLKQKGLKISSRKSLVTPARPFY